MDVFNIEAEMASLLSSLDEDELRSFAESQEEDSGSSDRQIELYIYSRFLVFKRSCSTAHLEAAVQRAEGWLAVTAPDHPDRTRRFGILDMMLACMDQDRFIPRDVGPAVLGAHTSQEVTLDEISCLTMQATRLASACQHTRSLTDLNEAIRIMELALDMAGDGAQPAMVDNHGAMLGLRYSITNSLDDLDRAVDATTRALNAMPQGYADQMVSRHLQTWLNARFQRTGSTDDLNRLIDLAVLVVGATRQHDPYRAITLANLQTWLGTRFQQTGSMDDLNRIIDFAKMGLDAIPPGVTLEDGLDRERMLTNLEGWLAERIKRTRSIQDLNQVIDLLTAAVNTMPQDNPSRARRLHNLGFHLSTRFEQTRSIQDLNRAIDVSTTAANITSEDNPDRAAMLSSLANWLSVRFEQSGSMVDLDHAINVAATAADALSQTTSDQVSHLSNFGAKLALRFEQTGSMDDLSHAIDVETAAVDMMPEDYDHRADVLDNFGNLFSRRFERLGSMEDLNRAVHVAATAIDAALPDHPKRPNFLVNLGNYLRMRFEQAGSVDDIDRAINVIGTAIDAVPHSHANRGRYLHNLSVCLRFRFERTGSMADLNRAVESAAMALDAIPPGYFYRGRMLSHFGVILRIRFERTGSMDDLNRAAEVLATALDEMPEKHPDRVSLLSNHAANLATRFKLTDSIDDLNRAIDVMKMAADTAPPDYPSRALLLNNLVSMLILRLDRAGSIDDLGHILSSCREAWRSDAAVPYFRVRLARVAAGLLAVQGDWEESSRLLQDVVYLAPIVSPRSLKHTDKQHILQEFTGLASMAAAVALNAGKDVCHALQLLELGRGVIAGSLMDMRGDISDLRLKHLDLADEFVSLRDELDSPADETICYASSGDNISSWEARLRQRREADQRLRELVTRIRTQPGFGNFLLPPTGEQLMAAADPNPVVVVNLSGFRSDAFLIERDRIRAIGLPALGLKEAGDRLTELRQSRLTASADAMASLLEWLWDVICRPCLDALGLDGPVSGNNWPHIWWIPTGVLSQFPLHAAGRYAHRSADTVLDRTMSSYTSSVKALMYARRNVVEPQADSAVLVAMSKTPDLPTDGILPSVGREVDMLRELCPKLQLKPITPPQRKEDVLQYLRACKMFHFAGHGQSDPTEPSRSCLLLQDWKANPLTVGDLRDSRLQKNPPFLAYLSACSTGANDAANLADEGVHLVSAFQLAGFRHVVGTLWEVSDSHCVDVAKVLYETLQEEGMTDAAVCRGLHRAIRGIRDGRIRRGGAAGDREARDRDEDGDGEAGEDGEGEEGEAKEDEVRDREGRDALKLKRRASRPRAFFWVPYVHFGA